MNDPREPANPTDLSSSPLGSAPSGSRRAPITEVITRHTGASVRRIRKLRVVIVEAPAPSEHGRSHVFAQDEVRVGSSPDVDVPISDPSVSREHIAIRLGPHGWIVSDNGSTNGTFIGDLRVDKVTIGDEALVRVGNSVVRIESLSEAVEQEISPRVSFGRMLGASAAMREMFALLERVAPTDLTILVEGETGTGKELAAEGIHETSARAGALVTVNCGAIPRELIESELFGHEKGAFTGAIRERTGAFLAANKGTLFLDEVGELPLDMQAKLLRVLERQEVKPVGSDRAFTVDARIVAATNRNLSREVAAGRFRQDLYYRLAVVVVRVPPLRTRLEDLRMLIDHIQDELGRRRLAAGQPPCERLDETAVTMLMRYDFPGNVRELRNVVERWSVLGSVGAPGGGGGVEAPSASGSQAPATSHEVDAALLSLPYHEAKEAWVERFEREYIDAALQRSGGNVSKASRDAGIDRRHLQRMMSRFNIKSE